MGAGGGVGDWRNANEVGWEEDVEEVNCGGTREERDEGLMGGREDGRDVMVGYECG